jgi:leucyl-tRNA synthetase
MMFTDGTKVDQNLWGVHRPQEFEAKWQRIWEESGIYRADQTSVRPKYYCLDFFPYPSGEGLHVGHCRNYIPTDLLSRFMRMRGYNVLHPMGWDSFGEPTEQYAVSHGIHPRASTDRNTANFRRQMTMIGTSYDWTREIDSSDPSFYRWTQWFFLLLYKRGLAYRDTSWQWWCPTCLTTISSHEAAGGVCWRGHTGISKREIPAWYFKITEYADELISGLDDIDWPENIKTMQRNWIGRSKGYEFDFELVSSPGNQLAPSHNHLSVFSTRPDTLFGATFFLLAPEHPLVDSLTSQEQLTEVIAYRAQTSQKSEVERMLENREKTGVFTGSYVINPINGDSLPVWVADYVLPGYGTGAIMGVPAHDQRDFEFANRHRLAIRPVIIPHGQSYVGGQSMDQIFVGEGYLVNSGSYSGLSSQEAAQRIGDDLVEKGVGRTSVQYRIRDWLISRQRYWGTPIPIVYCEDCGAVPVPETALPVLLPKMDDFLPDGSGRSPLARLPEFVHTTCPACDGPAQRETDTMGGFACSSWYFLRFTSPDYSQAPFEPSAMFYWMPVNLYIGGAEHAVLHLLYSRFWVKVMADAGLVPFREPFSKLLSQGQLMAPDGLRMSKSRGNVITPDQIIEAYGADALRIYELFMAPFDQDVEWNTEGINGARRFLNRVWNLFADTYAASADAIEKDLEVERRMHRTIRQVTKRIQDFRLNTMISTFMEYVSFMVDQQRKNNWYTASYHEALSTLLILLAPAAPHLCEELWHLTGHHDSVHQQEWPDWDSDLAKEQVVEIAVQVNGRLRDVLEVPVDIDQVEVTQYAAKLDKIQPYIAGRKIARSIYVPGKVINIITSE